MRVILLYFIVFYMGTKLSAQDEGIMFPYEFKFSYEIEKEKEEKNLSDWKVAQEYTYIGDYEKSYKSFTSTLSYGLDTTANTIDYTSIEAVDAISFIVNKSTDHNLVIISESHIRPQHRILTRKLLQGLYQQGFRHLAMEALVNSNIEINGGFFVDKNLSNRGYPLFVQNTGSYIREPEMAAIIREAISIGFTVFGYEDYQNPDIPRDSAAALQIKSRLNEFNTNKVVVHCGFDHAIESPIKRKEGYWLAYYLKNMLDTDPLTVYQNIFTETGDTTKEYPHYRMLLADKPSIFIDQDDEPVQFFNNFNHFDLLVYHPPTMYIHNRPHWTYDETDVHYFVPKLNEDLMPVIIKAIPFEDDPMAVPIDIVELENPDDKTPLVLPPGKYRIDLLYHNGAIDIRTVTIE